MAGKPRVIMSGSQTRHSVISDPELIAWLREENQDEYRELIIEAKVPLRTVLFSHRRNGYRRFESMEGGDDTDRDNILAELRQYLSTILGDESVTVLKSAGAVAVRANRQQLEMIVFHPLVKAIRINRQLP